MALKQIVLRARIDQLRAQRKPLEEERDALAQSEHARFTDDQTLFRATARYDGKPVIAEAFVAISINGAAINAGDVTFAQDTANA